MCLRRDKSQPLPIPANPVQPRVENEMARKDPLPDEKELLDPDKVADVTYGNNNKAGLTAKRGGTSALTIGLNQGAGSTNTGINV